LRCEHGFRIGQLYDFGFDNVSGKVGGNEILEREEKAKQEKDNNVYEVELLSRSNLCFDVGEEF
jgi:hypothetical protein